MEFFHTPISIVLSNKIFILTYPKKVFLGGRWELYSYSPTNSGYITFLKKICVPQKLISTYASGETQCKTLYKWQWCQFNWSFSWWWYSIIVSSYFLDLGSLFRNYIIFFLLMIFWNVQEFSLWSQNSISPHPGSTLFLMKNC